MRLAIVIATIASAVASSAVAASALAQASDQAEKPSEAAKPAPAEAVKPTSGGPDSTTETFGDWSIVCSTSAGACEVNTMVVLRGQSAPFARIAATRPAKDKKARLMALVPVNVSIASPVKISGESGKAEFSLPLKSCVPAGCLAEAEVSKEQLQAFGAPGKTSGQLSLVDAAGKAATVQFSLRGLDQALEAYFRRQE
jgi:invasion protein IalB